MTHPWARSIGMVVASLAMAFAPESDLARALRGVFSEHQPITTLAEAAEAAPESGPQFLEMRGDSGPMLDRADIGLQLALFATLTREPQVRPATESDTAAWHALVTMRDKHPAFSKGKLVNLHADAEVYAFVREFLGSPGTRLKASQRPEHLLVIVNVAAAERAITLNIGDSPLFTPQELRVLRPAGTAKLSPGKIAVTIPPRSLAIYDVRCGCDVE